MNPRTASSAKTLCPTVRRILNPLTPFRDSLNDLEKGPFLGGPTQLAHSGGSMTMTGARRAAPLTGPGPDSARTTRTGR